MKKNLIPCLLSFAVLFSCNSEQKEMKTLQVKLGNELNVDRQEVVSLKSEAVFDNLQTKDTINIHIKDSSGQVLRHQWVDLNEDGQPEEFLFLAKVGPNSTNTYHIGIDSTAQAPKNEIVAFSRFVPERTDDYTWENDRVAFRTYGPTGQKEALEGVPGSTLSSGIDIWLKRTEKPVINKWYAEHVKNPGYYHIDHGEGYDPYHVGNSRGLGGSGVFENDSLYVSENFVDYKTIAAGPLKTIFELQYDAWGPYDVKETKRISLALGSNFFKNEVILEANDSIPNYAIGISLHQNQGTYELNKDQGWAMHWETIDSTRVGEGLVINPAVLDSVFAYKSRTPDQSNILMLTRPKDTITYYAGFAWDKSGQVSGQEDWKKMLQKQAEILKNPLQISLSK